MTSAALVGLVLGSLTLVGCSNPSESTARTETAPPAESAPANAPSDDFCGEFVERGGNGATFTMFALWEPRANILNRTTEVLGVMGDIQPPETIANEWAQYKDLVTRVHAAVDALPEDGRLMLNEGVGKENSDDESGDVLTDYYFDTCK